MKKICVALILLYLKTLARITLKVHKPYIIGIAGSAGKSSCRNAVYAVLQDHLSVKKIHGNSETGIPLGLLGFRPDGYTWKDWIIILLKAPFGIHFLNNTKYIVVEMGIDEPYPPKNMEYLLSFMRPHIAISLNVSSTHTQQFEKVLPHNTMNEKERNEYLMKAIAREDTKIITQSNCLIGIYNADDLYVTSAIDEQLLNQPELYTFGKEKSNTIWYGDYGVHNHKSVFHFDLHNEKITCNFQNYLLPEVYTETFAAAILVGHILKIPLISITDSLTKNFRLPAGRASFFDGKNNSLIIDSTYNSSRRSVLSFLDLVHQLKKDTKRPVFFLCGDMNELGNESKIEHEALLDPIAATVDYLYCVGPETKKYIYPHFVENKKLKEVQWFETALHAANFFKDSAPHSAIILAKGSQNRVFLEETIKELLQDSKDLEKLCRQEEYWMEIKRKYFASKSG